MVQRYGSGIGNYLDVLSIEQQLLQAQRQLANLNAEQIDLSIQLMQALGGGFQGEALTAANATTQPRSTTNSRYLSWPLPIQLKPLKPPKATPTRASARNSCC